MTAAGMSEADIIEAWEERSAIAEFDAGLHRIQAEILAIREATARHGMAAGQVIAQWRREKEAAK